MKDRILQIIEYLGVSNRAFEIKCGLSNGYINSMRRNLGLEKLENILKAYPEINRSWLVNGEGTMLKTDATATSIIEAEKRVEESEEIAELKKEIEFLKGIVSTQKATIDRLLSEPQPPHKPHDPRDGKESDVYSR